tara:strand:+ start:326 stop:3283 length:2958 start_codon:yes stop_codon:yes gene_type:complete
MTAGLREQMTLQEASLSSTSTTLFDASWSNTNESSFVTYLEKWNPDGFSNDFIDRFGPNADLSEFDEPEIGVLNSAIAERDADFVDDLLSYVLESEFDEGYLSFAIVYALDGERLFCGSAFDYGIDPCSSTAKIDFQSPLNTFLQRTVRSKRQIIFVDDVSNEEASTINQAIVFPVKNAKREIIGVTALARNMFSNIELYEELYEVRAAIITPDYELSMEDYDTVEDGVFGINDIDALIEAAKSTLQASVSRSIFTERRDDLGASVTVLSLSDYLPGGRANLVIFQDQQEQIDALSANNYLVYSVVIALIVLITLGVVFITAKAFAGITSAISVLQSLTNDQLDAQMPARKGLLASDTDEVGQLAESLESYRATLLENRANAEDRYQRRRQRDQIILEKMSNLAEQLDGDAKQLMTGDIERMKELSEQESENDREDSSIEMMSLAFTRMSDEVNQLIKAKTEDMEAARDEAISANANRAQFFNNMSHELRTPLNAVLGYSEMLQEECEDMGYDDLLPDIERINTSGRHLLALINDVLDLSKIEAGKMEVFPTNFDIENVVEMLTAINTPLSEKTGNAFVIEQDQVSGTMYSDETKLRQILTNFLSNGFKNTEKGTVTLRITPEAATDGSNREMIRFSVIDTGTGIPPEALETLFDEFTQVQTSTMQKAAQVQASTGLGLAVTKKLAEMMGGTVAVTSEMGVGSDFSLILPRNISADDDDLVAVENTEAVDSEKPYVVLIDDDPAIHEVVKRTLKKADINLIGTTDGERGLQIIRDKKPGLILLDVYMSGRDGWSILREIKTDESIKDVPVAMVTQLSEEKFAESLGADGYFTKPIDRAVFVQEVHRLLGSEAASESKVLVVDDDENTRELLSRILSDEGFSATSAEDGMAGLELIKSTLNDDDRPRLIVLDIEMPRMDGLQFLDAYSEQVAAEQHVPIVIFSGKDMSTTQQEILDQFDNVKGFVPKGDMSNLTSFISKLNLEQTG